ncbi:hypothetical protein BDN70DRAFT_900845 [Pholiota conissans]|uniref:Uncharacterized protein n=1 Tax=Pholiota conissans TaxID=109636 RepID=A0A9P5YQD9_9AGAR|nr:hypothetical protein BDN70DRAFT_900845 [Pholiota conissans]
MDEHVTYVTQVVDAPKLTQHQAFYQRNSRRLKQEARERWRRNRENFETLSKPEQEVARERRRKSWAVYREKHRDELREKERMRRYDSFQTHEADYLTYGLLHAQYRSAEMSGVAIDVMS